MDFYRLEAARPPDSPRTADAGLGQIERTRCRVLLFFQRRIVCGLSNRVTSHCNDDTGITGMLMTKKYNLNTKTCSAVSF